MTALIVIGIIAALITALLLCPVGVTAEYSEDGALVLAHMGIIRLKLFPRKKKEPKEQKPKKEKKKVKKKEKAEPEEEKKGGKLENLLSLASIVKDALGRFRRKLRVKELTLYYQAGSEDAHKAAMSFGYASLGAGMLVPLLENIFVIKNRDIRLSVSFTEPEARIYAKLKLTIAIGSILYIAIVFLTKYFRRTRMES